MSLKMKLLFAGAKVYWHIFQPINFGAQVMLVRDGQVVLVRHTYKMGWSFPGGGVKRKESVETAVRREAMEEVGGTLGEVKLIGIYDNLRGPTSDHITLFLCHDFELNGKSDDEIAEVKFFPLDQLPEDIGRGTRRRIEEYLSGESRPAFGEW
ncbi:MAG: NUDIX domain-containing protein [Ardenticatenaceae bacterium]|nr:NUDIX domain-containing protein [Ardenticatenaceae bacterium]